MDQDLVYLILPSARPASEGTEFLLLRQGSGHPWQLPAGPVSAVPGGASLSLRQEALVWAEHLLGRVPERLSLCAVAWGSPGSAFCFRAEAPALPGQGGWAVESLGIEARWLPAEQALEELSGWESGVLHRAMTAIETGSMMEWEMSVPGAAGAFDSGG